MGKYLPSSSSPPIASFGGHAQAQREAIFKPYGIYTADEIMDLGLNAEQTGSFWTTRETSFSGADIRIFLMVYGSKARDAITAKIASDLGRLDTEREITRKQLAQEQGRMNQYSDHYNSDIMAALEQKQQDQLGARILLEEEQAKLTAMSHVAFLDLAEAQTLSVSTHRDKFPVRALGSAGPRGFTRGMRVIAGTMIFTVFNRHPLGKVLYGDFYSFEGFNDSKNEGYELPDQLPPMDLLLLGANEYGYLCRMVLYGVEFVSEGMTFSIEDLITETQLQYVARDMDPLRDIRTEQELINPAHGRAWSISGSDLIKDADYQKYRRRQNPFL